MLIRILNVFKNDPHSVKGFLKKHVNLKQKRITLLMSR